MPGLNDLDGILERFCQDALADRPKHKAKYPTLKVLADDPVDIGFAVGPARKDAGVARRSSPNIESLVDRITRSGLDQP